jgi:hypothetical protein
MLWDVSAARPDRDVVLVGDRLAAVRWLLARRPACRKAERVAGTAGLWGLSARRIHVVLLPGYRRRLRRPALLRVGVWVLQLRGATVERG